jgi:hypothetical protein
MISAMECLLEAENCLTAAQVAVDADERAEYLRQSACYRNLALDLMRGGKDKLGAFSLKGGDDPCCADCAAEVRRHAG